MAITSLGGIGGAGPTNVSNASNNFETVINSIASGTNQSQDIANLSIAAQLQSSNAALNVAAGNLVQALSLSQVAEGGVGQIQQIVGQLQSLAGEAQSPVLNANNRKQLNQQFQQLTSTLDKVASTASFNGQKLLDGSQNISLNNLLVQGDTGGDSNSTLSIPDLSSQSLLGGQLDISTPDGALQALNALGDAQNQVTGVQTNIGAFAQSADFAAANVDVALANQQAAQSTLSDTDFAAASTQLSLADVQYNAAIATVAQGNNLNPALLQLIG